MYTHYRGTTFQFVGALQNNGKVQDMTGATLLATVYDRTGTVEYGALTVNVVNPATGGIIGLSYPNTLPWPVGNARIDCVLTLPQGNKVASDPIFFRVAQNPILG